MDMDGLKSKGRGEEINTEWTCGLPSLQPGFDTVPVKCVVAVANCDVAVLISVTFALNAYIVI